MKTYGTTVSRYFPVLVLFLVLYQHELSASGKHLNLGKHEIPENLVEKFRSFTYSYAVKGKIPVEIENNFGDVKVKLWDKPEVRIDVVITANAATDDKADTFLKMVSIESADKSGRVILKTVLDCMGSSYSNNISGNQNDDRNFLRVDCRVYMPAGHDLSVNNSHGDVYIPYFKDKLVINQKYGILYADHLTNPHTRIDVNFGKAFIKSMTGGKLSSNQTTLLIDRVNAVQMNSICGSVQVLEASKIDFQASYTCGFIKKVKEDCRFQVKYSKEFRLGEIEDKVEQVEIESSHTNLELPLCLKGKYEVVAEVLNTPINVADEPKVKYLKTAAADSRHMIIGSSASDQATRVLLTTRYGKVEMK